MTSNRHGKWRDYPSRTVFLGDWLADRALAVAPEERADVWDKYSDPDIDTRFKHLIKPQTTGRGEKKGKNK